MRERHKDKVPIRAWPALLALVLIFCRANSQTSSPAAVQAPNQAEPQPAKLRVRLYAIHSPAAMRVSPRDASTQVSLCSRCPFKPLANALEIRAAASRLVFPTEGSAVNGRMAEENATVVRISGTYRLESPSNAPVELALPLELRAEDGLLRVELQMPLEDYVAAVVAGEGAGFTSEESRKALAVVARTFALHFRGRHRAEGFDLCDTTHCQDLHLGAVNGRMRAAAEATRGEILWYEGKPAAAFHHRHCGGSTEDARAVWPDEAAPYLRAHPDAYCLARDAGRWNTEIAKRDIARALAASHIPAPATLAALTIAERSASGRAVRLLVAGGSGQERTEVRAADLRFAVGRALGWDKVPSDLYDLRDTGDAIVFDGRGAGHGVGMCQTGAAELGSRRRTHREILAFYFPGTTLAAATP